MLRLFSPLPFEAESEEFVLTVLQIAYTKRRGWPHTVGGLPFPPFCAVSFSLRQKYLSEEKSLNVVLLTLFAGYVEWLSTISAEEP